MEAVSHIQRIQSILGPLCECVVRNESGHLVVQFKALALTDRQATEISLLSREFNQVWADVRADWLSRKVTYFPPPKAPNGEFYTTALLEVSLRKHGVNCKIIH